MQFKVLTSLGSIACACSSYYYQQKPVYLEVDGTRTLNFTNVGVCFGLLASSRVLSMFYQAINFPVLLFPAFEVAVLGIGEYWFGMFVLCFCTADMILESFCHESL